MIPGGSAFPYLPDNRSCFHPRRIGSEYAPVFRVLRAADMEISLSPLAECPDGDEDFSMRRFARALFKNRLVKRAEFCRSAQPRPLS